MLNIKANLFLNLTKRQKSTLISSLKNFVKINQNLSVDDILYKFLDEEKYYVDIDNPHLYFVVENIDDESFLKDIKIYINFILDDIEYKKKIAPLLLKEKEIQKEQKRKMQEYKMKKEPPTPSQIKYYKKLCKNHSIEMTELDGLSKFDLKNMISEILEKYQG